ncbi:hypothetical protein [Piscinibacter sp. HJYY11]|uniref:hypothetical protein n=1 Tax=Piscinibacter sp. HJYY11 TaxID=2801333 RepID=UPI00191CC623|nr:hypothetical protein [Piscinibacter sp. HJYY11]MBL0726203.1 hypothetical protein [Piscinibacter sp. HJYY11]
MSFAQQTATVYSFKSYTRAEDGPELSTFKATRRAIAFTFLGEVVEGTAEQVELSALDPQGAYRRVATGWGELGKH